MWDDGGRGEEGGDAIGGVNECLDRADGPVLGRRPVIYFSVLQRERHKLQQTEHVIPSLEWIWLVSMQGPNEERWLHPADNDHETPHPGGLRSMQTHKRDIEHYTSTFIRHNPTIWITFRRNMYVVPVQSNQLW